jgi:4a-hydroxytetrahydrobiopterin dehydratase
MRASRLPAARPKEVAVPGLLSDADVAEALGRLNGWAREGNAITRQYQFADFRAAMWFLNAAAAAADAMDHHPEWCNVYNRVTVKLSTHDAGGITTRDIRLAESMDKIAG